MKIPVVLIFAVAAFSAHGAPARSGTLVSPTGQTLYFNTDAPSSIDQSGLNKAMESALKTGACKASAEPNANGENTICFIEVKGGKWIAVYSSGDSNDKNLISEMVYVIHSYLNPNSKVKRALEKATGSKIVPTEGTTTVFNMTVNSAGEIHAIDITTANEMAVKTVIDVPSRLLGDGKSSPTATAKYAGQSHKFCNSDRQKVPDIELQFNSTGTEFLFRETWPNGGVTEVSELVQSVRTISTPEELRRISDSCIKIVEASDIGWFRKGQAKIDCQSVRHSESILTKYTGSKPDSVLNILDLGDKLVLVHPEVNQLFRCGGDVHCARAQKFDRYPEATFKAIMEFPQMSTSNCK